MIYNKIYNKHGFHLVDPSPWPFFSAISVLMLTFGAVMFFHGYLFGSFL
jgi:cytochrome c oxidase subunit 3